jgi:branched-subunit amino acid ABC-type transport system permease component
VVTRLRHSRDVVAGLAVAGGVVAVISQAYRPSSFSLNALLTATVFALFIGASLALSATGLVVTYTTTGIFNFAQGAIAMLGAFLYWQLRFDWGVPAPIAVALVVLVAAPLFGAALDRVLMRRIVDAPLVVQIVVTISLLFALLAVANYFWNFSVDPNFPAFFASSRGSSVLGVNVSWHYAITIAAGAGLAVFLRLFLYRTRTGITMRAVVDDRPLAALTGARPERASMLAWALSCSLAATAGILIAPDASLNKAALTLLVIDAFAAAIVGRLRSLPLTFAGAILLGMVKSYSATFLVLGGRWFGLQNALPAIVLLVALFFVPYDRLDTSRATMSHRLFRVPKLGEAALGFAAIAVAMVASSYLFSDFEGLNRLTSVMTIAVLLLSLVPLTGWSGQVSLGQSVFVGVGFWGFGAHFANTGNVLGFGRAALVAAVAGVLVALPALRLRGLYLALATFAIASAAGQIFYTQSGVLQNQIDYARPTLFGFDLTHQRTFLAFSCIVFGVVGLVLVAIRRSRYGRRLIAIRDSPAAAATLGVNLTRAKLVVFALSAAIAGVAGGLIAMNQLVASNQNPILNPVNGLSLLLFVVIGGVTFTSGAFAGGAFSELINFVKLHLTVSPFAGMFKALDEVAPALAAVSVLTNPDGIAGSTSAAFGRLLPWRRSARSEGNRNGIDTVAGETRGFSPDDLRAMDRRLGVPAVLRVDMTDVDPGSLVAATLHGQA